MDKSNEIMEQYCDFKKIKRGMLIKGEVVSYYKDEIVVNINYFCDGIVKKDGLLRDSYSVGDDIDVYVVSLDDGFGNVVLSEKEAYYKNVVNELKNAFNRSDKVTVKVKDCIEHGLVCDYKGIRGFIPRSRVSIKKTDFKEYLGKDLEVLLIEFDIDKNKVVFSRKEIEIENEENRRIEIMNSLNVGDRLIGIVKNVKDFGAFVDIGGIQGFVHRSEITHKNKFDIYDVLKVGDKVTVYILNFDKINNKISFTMKDPNYNPFLEYKNDFKEEGIYDVIITKIINEGLIVSLNDYLTGFIHKSELSDDVVNLHKSFKIGDKIKAKIISINYDDEKISLSHKDATNAYEQEFNYVCEEECNDTLGDVFKDVFSKLK